MQELLLTILSEADFRMVKNLFKVSERGFGQKDLDT